MTKNTAVIQTFSSFEKVHKNDSYQCLQNTINTRAAEIVSLTNFRATNGEHVPYTAAKDQQSDCEVQRKDCAQKTYITTFAARGDILKGRQPLKAAFCRTFCRSKKYETLKATL